MSLVFVFLLMGCSDKNEQIKLTDINMVTECKAQECDTQISETISASEFKQKWESKEYDLIDIRTRDEYVQERIADVPNIDIYQGDFEQRLNYLDKNKKYLIYCRSGSRSKAGLQKMRELGFREVYDLGGGIIEWKNLRHETKSGL